MELGVKLPNSGPLATPHGLAELAAAAEELGFASVWVQDHVTRSPSDAEYHFSMGAYEAWDRPVVPDVYEALLTLQFVAGHTSHIRIGSSAIVLPLRNPIWLAKQAATLDRLSGGRLILGVAVGGAYVRQELRALGADGVASQRGKLTNEFIPLLRRIWSEASVDFDGDYITVASAEVYPKPVGAIPIWVGGRSHYAHERAATLGDGWIAIMETPESISEAVDYISSAASSVGRNMDDIAICSEHWVCIDKDSESANERSIATREAFSSYLARSNAAQDDVVDDLAGREEEYNLIGTPDQVLKKLASYEAAGVDHLILRFVARTVDEAIEGMQLIADAQGAS